MNAPLHHDLLILGAGPAGSMAALVAARAGLSVAVIDKARFPRPKICGDCLHPSVWDIFRRQGLDTSFSLLPHQPLTRLRLSSDFNNPLEFVRSAHPDGQRAVSRENLDHWLMKEAQQAGASYFTETTPLSLSLEKNGTLLTDRGEFRGKVLVGADGRNSWLARVSGLSRPNPRCPRVAWQTSLDCPGADDAVHMTFFPEGYFGLARNGTGPANLCMVLRTDSGVHPSEIAARYFPGSGDLDWHSVHPIARAPARPSSGNILLVGDAARVVEPFTGEGIALALASGELAGKLSAQAVHHQTIDRLSLEYQAAHLALYRGLSWQNALTRWLGIHPSWGCRTVRWLGQRPGLARRICQPFL
ncbi:MAG: FAD-dependent monooxygenase [Candidatus Methylacidiphilales bacterium]|nr:FAD-dependent monooxygenase [Candidatus Methylacidiphilales bacterium]